MASVCPRCGAVFTGAGCGICGDTLLSHGVRDPMIDRLVAGRFRILRKLGQGGMGAVYLAEQMGIGHRVALKFLNATLVGRPELAQRFLNEARSYARIAHPHAVTFHEFGQDEDGNLFISMEYIEGPDLKTILERDGRLPPGDAVEIVLQVADALEHAHANGVIHRDLKPENVIVRQGMRGPHAKVLDFGIARLLTDDNARLTIAGSIAGTPQYMPPEQVQGRDVDARADVYVLGIVLFELLTGVQPFYAPSIPEMLARQTRDPVPLLRDAIPEHDLRALDQVIQQATAKEREKRFPSMAAFATALLHAAGTPAFRSLALGPGGTWVPTRATTPEPVPAPERTAGGTWIRGPAVATPQPIPAPEQTAGGTWIRGPAAAQAPDPAWVKAPLPPLPPARVEKKRRSRAPIVILAVLLGGAAWRMLGGALPTAATDTAAVDTAAVDAAVVDPAPAPPQAPAPAPAQAKQPADAVPASHVPDDQKLRQALLAKEIWLKANAEFLSGNLASAREILSTVPKDDEIAPKVRQLRAQLDEVASLLSKGRALSRKGDCTTAIAVFDKILAKNPGIREAAAERAACRRMLPPSLAE